MLIPPILQSRPERTMPVTAVFGCRQQIGNWSFLSSESATAEVGKRP